MPYSKISFHNYLLCDLILNNETWKCHATRLVKIQKIAWNEGYCTYLQMYQKKPEWFILPCPGSLNLI
jgi:hypothetical protein